MPYACLLFADDVEAFMRSAADSIAEGSAFEPHPLFHVPLIGSLHHYTADEVARAGARTTRGAPPSFHFSKWELCGSLLRATVESAGARALAGRMHFELPRGRTWGSLYVTVGSVAAIDAARRDEFLAAVEAAFPIDPSIEYGFKNHLAYNEHKPNRSAKPQPARSAKPTSSPHRKWVRGKPRPDAGPTSMDTTSTTGSMGSTTAVRSAGIVKHGLKNAVTFASRTTHARRRQGPLARR